MSLENDIFAIASRIHVGLRRKFNRIIDVEYILQSPVYGREVVRLARASQDSSLAEMANRLETCLFNPKGLFPEPPPPVNRSVPLATYLAQHAVEQAKVIPNPPAAVEQQYVYSLR